MKAMLEICSNNEWVRIHSDVDFDRIPPESIDEAIEWYIIRCVGFLQEAGYEVEYAKNARQLCHVWNGTKFKARVGIVGTFDDLCDEYLDEVCNILQDAAKSMTERFNEPELAPWKQALLNDAVGDLAFSETNQDGVAFGYIYGSYTIADGDSIKHYDCFHSLLDAAKRYARRMRTKPSWKFRDRSNPLVSFEQARDSAKHKDALVDGDRFVVYRFGVDGHAIETHSNEHKAERACEVYNRDDIREGRPPEYLWFPLLKREEDHAKR